ETCPMETVGTDRVFLQETRNGIGELDLTAATGQGLLQQIEDAGLQNISPNNRHGTWCLGRRWLFHNAAHNAGATIESMGVHYSVTASSLWRNVLDREDAATTLRSEIRHL